MDTTHMGWPWQQPLHVVLRLDPARTCGHAEEPLERLSNGSRDGVRRGSEAVVAVPDWGRTCGVSRPFAETRIRCGSAQLVALSSAVGAMMRRSPGGHPTLLRELLPSAKDGSPSMPGVGPGSQAEPSLAVVPPVGGRLPGAGRSSDSRARICRSTYCPPLPRLFGPVLDDGGRSRLPLRGSPGVSPGSLLPLHRRDGGEPVAGPTLRQRDSTTRSTGVSRRGEHDPELTCYAR